MSKTKKALIVFACATVILLTALLCIFFFDDVKGVIAGGTEEGTTESTTAAEEPTDDDRGHIFLTYSEQKTLCEYFFAYNCKQKAEEAVASGKYESELDYVYDEEFDKNALEEAYAAVEAGTADSVLDYMSNHEDAGKMSFMLYFDPMYAAAWGCYLDQMGVSGDTKILAKEQDLPVPQQPDAAIQRFVDSEDDWDEAIARIQEILWADNATAELKELTDYTSAMYAKMDGICSGMPSVIVAQTSNAGGHFIVITYNGVELKFRLECGYQPISIPNWTPSLDIIPDNPTKYSKDPADDPTNATGAEDSDAKAPDMNNKEPMTEETPDPEPEKNNPDVYEPPEPPTEEATTEAPTDGTTVDPKDDTGSDADDKNGEVEKSKTTDQDATVTAGDGEDHGDFNTIDKDPAQRSTTEEQFSGESDGDPGAPE